jgi:hypothetical protein
LSVPLFDELLLRSLFELSENPSFVETVFQRFGKSVIIPRPIISHPEKLFQNVGETPIKTVEALRRSENIKIEILSEAMII